MRRILLALLALIVLGTAPAFAGPVVNVYAGYLNNLSGPPNPADIPNPFDPSASTILISSGGSTATHDTGVIRFENVGTTPVTIDPGLNVVTQGAVFQIWDGALPIILAPGQSLVLAETVNFNFDSSDFGLGLDPVVSGSVDGVPFSFTDTARILLGHEDVSNTPETTPYGLLGTIGGGSGGAVPEPGTLSLLALGAAAAMSRVRRRK